MQTLLLARAAPAATGLPALAAALRSSLLYRNLSTPTAVRHSSTTGSSNATPATGDAAADTNGGLHVTVEPLSGTHEGVSVISLTRPEARNAIGRQLLRELAEALDTVRQERTTRCVLVRSGVTGGAGDREWWGKEKERGRPLLVRLYS